MQFAEKLRQLRTSKNLSMKKFSEQSGIPYNTITSIESRKRNHNKIPRITTVIRIAKFYNILVDDLIRNVDFN